MQVKFRIEPLSEKTLKEAIRLNLEEFEGTTDEFDYAPMWFKASLYPEKFKDLIKKDNVNFLKYFVAIEENSGKVIGTSGLYDFKDELDTGWLGWFVVDPEYRGKGIGTQLLDFAINLAKKMGKKKFKLYTSDHPDEADAQKLYEKKGLKIIGKEKIPGNKYYKIYREMKI